MFLKIQICFKVQIALSADNSEEHLILSLGVILTTTANVHRAWLYFLQYMVCALDEKPHLKTVQYAARILCKVAIVILKKRNYIFPSFSIK